MYLSQLTLNPLNRQVLSELARPYEMHRTLTTRCFDGTTITAQHNTTRAEAPSTGAHGLLFRLDEDSRNNQIVLLAQSQTEPNWAGLPDGYALEVHGPKVFNLKDKLAAGQMFGFRLRANPTKRMGKSAERQDTIGKRVGIYEEEDQLKWLTRKGEQHGFKVLRAQIEKDQVLTGHKKEHAMKWLSVQFNGVIEVQDPTELHNAIAYGIGTAKGYGFGLLSLSPLNRQ